MAVPQTSLVPKNLQEDIRTKILTRLQYGKDYWRPLHARMDYWALMYHMQDVIQQMKPVGYRRFVSNEPHTAVDLAASILTRNDAYWRIALFEQANENSEERHLIGKVERTLQGIVYDIDDMLSQRLKPRLWKQAAWQALLRGYIWGKVHITTDALKYRATPIVAEMYDPRLVYPHVDAYGLNYVIIESQTSVGDLVNMYPETFGFREHEKNYDPNRPAVKVEYWSNDRGESKGICAVLAAETMVEDAFVYDLATMGNGAFSGTFVIPPYYHGYSPEALPVVGVPVNGINLPAKPRLGQVLTDRLVERQELTDSPSAVSWWSGQHAWIADSGRSILASVEEHVPQYNELIATIMQHLAISAYGTWVFTSPTGEQPRFQPGIESKIALTPEEKLDRVQIGPINQDAFRLVEILGDEKQNGMLANILRAGTPFQGTGVLFQQMASAALNALEPFQDGMEEFGQRLGTSILAQLQMASSTIKPFELITPRSAGSSKRQSFWVVEFDPKKDLNKKRRLRPRPVFRPALPDDLAVRINAARLALDPRRPILSLTTVLEHILQIEDVADEIDRIWEDIANTDPIIVFEQIATALERMGETDLASRIKEKEFRQSFVEELAFRQQSGGAIPAPGQMPNMPPEAGGAEFNAQQNESQGFAAGQAAAEAAVAGATTGAMGMRAGV